MLTFFFYLSNEFTLLHTVLLTWLQLLLLVDNCFLDHKNDYSKIISNKAFLLLCRVCYIYFLFSFFLISSSWQEEEQVKPRQITSITVAVTPKIVMVAMGKLGLRLVFRNHTLEITGKRKGKKKDKIINFLPSGGLGPGPSLSFVLKVPPSYHCPGEIPNLLLDRAYVVLDILANRQYSSTSNLLTLI